MYSARLNKLVALIPPCEVLADVGCDHGYVGIQALRLGKVKRVAFTDISQPSLAKARHNCPREFGEVTSFYCQDGLGEVVADCAVIAGMGGLEIISILTQARHLPEKLVLQPMRNQRDVRKYLTQGYRIVTDVKFFDGKYYDAIFALKCNTPQALTEEELEFGLTNIEQPSADFISYLQHEQTKLNKILEGTKDNEVSARRDLVEQTLKHALTKHT